MNNTYYLAGFINTFNISPGFVTPVFNSIKQEGYFIQFIEDNKIIIDNFNSFSDSFFLSKVEFYRIYASDYEIVDLENEDCNHFYDLEQPIFGFQTEKSIFYGGVLSFTKFLSKFETDDEFLREEISDFKENIMKKCSMIDTNVRVYDKDSIIEQYCYNPYHPEQSIDSFMYFKNLPVTMHEMDLLEPFNCYLNMYIEFIDDNTENSNDLSKQLEDLDRQLKSTHYSSDEYAILIAKIYELLFEYKKGFMRYKDATKKF